MTPLLTRFCVRHFGVEPWEVAPASGLWAVVVLFGIGLFCGWLFTLVPV